MRLSEARLHAESSTCMYSEHGFDALMRPEFGQVCHSLMVVSYWTPGSAQRQAASAIWLSRSAAPTRETTSLELRAVSSHSSPRSARSMNSSVTRTELFAFWYWIDANASESSRMSKPASRRAIAFSSSRALHQMKSRTSGWSTSSTTIFAARRVLPPDLIVPAQASAPRMKLTGPDARPPFERCSFDARMRERLIPEPGAAAEDHALLGVPVEDRLDRVLDREDEAGRALRVLLEAHVEPDRRVERRHLVKQDVGELVLEGLGVLVGREVAALATPGRDRPGNAADHLLDRGLALGRVHTAAEVLLRDDVRRVLRPGLRELDPALLERRVLGIADDRVADLPLDRLEGVHAGFREAPGNADPVTSCGDSGGGGATAVRHDFSSVERLFDGPLRGKDRCCCSRRTDRSSRRVRADRKPGGAPP